MRVRFVAQPYDDQGNLRQFVEAVCADTQIHQLTCVVAWAKRSGLEPVAEDLATFRGRGGAADLLVGISQGGATRQGLEIALELFDTVVVVHDEGVTFHPKVYVAEGTTTGRIFVGSMNLTAGGLQANYEAALDVELDLDLEPDRALLEELNAYVRRLRADTGIALQLDGGLLAELAGTRRYRIRDEDAVPETHEPDEAHTIAEAPAGELRGQTPFGRSREAKRGFPQRHPPHRRPGQTRPGVPTGGTRPAPVPARVTAGRTVVRRWWKPLRSADAQRPPRAGTNVTGSLRLTQAGHPIDHRTYFRDTFFAGLPWGPAAGRATGEAIDVDFTTVLPGQPARVERLRIVHDPRRVAGQGNFATSIHWGSLMPDLRANDFTGYAVTLERYDDGSFSLTIARSETGPFIS